MNKRFLFPLLSLILALVPALIRAEGEKPQPDKTKHEETELGKSMEVMSKAWRNLRRMAANPEQNAKALELVAIVQAAAKKNLEFIPDLARDLPADKREKFIAGYREKMKETISALAQLETAFKAGDNKTAVEIIAQIGAMQKEGHKEYKRPE